MPRSNSTSSGPEASARSPALALSLSVTTAARMGDEPLPAHPPYPQARTLTGSPGATRPPRSTRTKMPSRGMTQSPA